MKVKIDGIEYEQGSESHIQALERQHQSKLDAAEKASKEATSALEKERADRKADAAEIATKARKQAGLVVMARDAHTLRARKFDEDAAVTADPASLLAEITKMVLGVDISKMSPEEAIGAIVKNEIAKGMAAKDEVALEEPPPEEPTAGAGDGAGDGTPRMLGGVTVLDSAYARMVERERSRGQRRKEQH